MGVVINTSTESEREPAQPAVTCESCQYSEIRKWQTVCLCDGRRRALLPNEDACNCPDYIADSRTPKQKFEDYLREHYNGRY